MGQVQLWAPGPSLSADDYSRQYIQRSPSRIWSRSSNLSGRAKLPPLRIKLRQRPGVSSATAAYAGRPGRSIWSGRPGKQIDGRRDADVFQDKVAATQALSVARRRRSEHTSVFAAELRSALVTDRIGCARGIGTGDEQSSRLLETQHLLILKRAHRGRSLEVTVERCRTHSHPLGELPHAQHLVEVRPYPCDRLTNLAEAAVHSRYLSKHASLRSFEQPVKDFAFMHRSEHRNVFGCIEEQEKPRPGIQQIGRDGADGEASGLAFGCERHIRNQR